MNIYIQRVAIWLAVLMGTLSATAYDFESGGIYYNVTSIENLEVEVTSGDNEYSGDFVIPATVSYKNRILTVTAIGGNAFYDCERLTSVTIPNSVTEIGEYAFYDCERLTSVTIPNSVTEIGRSAFSWCTSLTSVIIPNSVTEIGEYAFNYCRRLTSVIIPNSVTEIGRSAFFACESLTSVTIPNSVTEIGKNAFYACERLTEFTIPDNVLSVGSGVFTYCSSLKKLQIGSGISIMRGRDNGSWFNSSEDNMEENPPIEILHINDSDEILDLGSERFQSIPLKEAYIGRPLTSNFYSGSLNSIKTLEKIEFGGACTKIYPLRYCESLKTLILGEKITSVKEYISQDKLTEIYVKATIPPACNSFENKAYINTTLYIPKGSLAAYQEAENWKDFWNIVEYDFSSMNAIQTVSRDKTHVYVNGDVIVVNQPDSNLMFDIYDLSGRAIYHGNDNYVSGLSSGIYIVKVLGGSFKVAVK